jgi:hypothetical protein
MPPLPDLPRLSPVRQSAMHDQGRWNAFGLMPRTDIAFFLQGRDHGIYFLQTRACRSGSQDSIAPGACRIYRNASWRRAGRASWR